MSGARTITASATRIRASSTSWATKRGDTARIYLPPDANCLLCVTDHCLHTFDRINVVGGQAAGAAMAEPRRGGDALRGRGRHLDLRVERRRTASPTW
ncbi:hypothetical protein ACU4GR_02445 [Methylobacterium oryzae CBMB20]